MLILTGPSGSGKNTLIDLYSKKYEIPVLKFIDQKQNHLSDIFGEKTSFKEGAEYYPEDLENLLYFLRINTRAKP